MFAQDKNSRKYHFPTRVEEPDRALAPILAEKGRELVYLAQDIVCPAGGFPTGSF